MPNRQFPSLDSFYPEDSLIKSLLVDDSVQLEPATHETANKIVDEPFFFDPPNLN